MNNPTKVAAVAVGLISTWATAQADDFVVSVTPSVGQTLDDVEIFSAATTATNAGTTVTTQTNEALTSDLGPVIGGTTLSTLVSTSYGTSTSASGLFEGTDATFGLVATSNGFAVLGGTGTTGMTYGSQYGATGVTQAQALTGIQGASLAVASSLFPTGTGNALYTASDLTGSVTGGLYAFDANGAATSIGTWSVTPQATPEPATFAALGFGALGLLRRRKGIKRA